MSCMLYNYYKPRASVNDYSDVFTGSMFSTINVFNKWRNIYAVLLWFVELNANLILE